MSSTPVSSDPVAESLGLLKAGVCTFDPVAFARLGQMRQLDAADVVEELRRKVEFLGVQIIAVLEASDAAKVAGAPSVGSVEGSDTALRC